MAVKERNVYVRKREVLHMEAQARVQGNGEIAEGQTFHVINGTVEEKGIVYKLIKRAEDVICSLLGIVILSPVFAITAIAIKAEDGGNIFFKQTRIGKNKKKFQMYKFRSMCINADEIHEQLRKEYGCEDVSFKLKNDPRVTKVGVVIRKFNIDELPQLLNILRGEMSIVGPRPLPDYEFEEEQKSYHGRFDDRYRVPQGLTCYWQISNRSQTEFADRMQMDVDYAKKCNLWIDLVLTVKTFLAVITGKAEY